MLSLCDFFEIDNNSENILTGLTLINRNILEFRTFLNTHFVIRNSHQLDLETIRSHLTHDDAIEHTLKFLLRNSLHNNVLTFGFHKGRNEDVNNPFHFITPNSCISNLKGNDWQLLHKCIGTAVFVDLLINCSVFHMSGKQWVQVTGNIMNTPHKPPLWCSDMASSYKNVVFRTRNHMYKNCRDLGNFIALDDNITITSLSHLIYPNGLDSFSRKQRKWINLQLSHLIQNCRKQHNFLQILNSICPIPCRSSHMTNLDMSTSKKLVTKYVLVLIEKFIPMSLLGSKCDKSRLFSNIARLINLPLNGSLNVGDLLPGARRGTLFSVSAAKNQISKLHTNVQGTDFLVWLLSYFVPKVIGGFFYCTEISSTSNVVYFRHDVWKEITLPFMSKYFSKYLLENITCRNHYSYLVSDYNHNRIRVIPKKANGEYRVLSVPSRGLGREESLIHTINKIRTTKPIQAVLNYVRLQRKTHFEKLSTPFQIAEQIYTFKRDLLERYGQLPRLYFMKFDIASCYDSIPRKKVIDVLQTIMKKEENFYLKTFTVQNPVNRRVKSLISVNGSVVSLPGNIKIDKNKEFCITTQNVIESVEYELFKTTLLVGKKCYLRKDGLFQGSAFSPLLVDILYDDLLQNYTQFKCKNGHINTIIRIADDFLIISTDSKQIGDIKALALSDFDDYNASVNQEKIVVTDYQNINTDSNILQFCALNVDIQRLEIWKDPKSLNIPSPRFTSTKEIYLYLLDLLKLRLKYGILNGLLNSVSIINLQIETFIKNIGSVFIKLLQHRTIQKESFFDFLENLIFLILDSSTNITIPTEKYINIIRTIVFNSFLATLKSLNVKCSDVIECLRLQKQIYF